MSDPARKLRLPLALGQLGKRIGQVVEVRGELLAGTAALGLGDARGGDFGDKGRVLDDALVALGGEEGVGDGGVRAEGLGG